MPTGSATNGFTKAMLETHRKLDSGFGEQEHLAWGNMQACQDAHSLNMVDLSQRDVKL